MTIAIETYVVEAVSTKSKFPKFNSGGLLIGGKWVNVVKNVPITKFKKGMEYALQIETNEKGYDAVVGVELSTGVPLPPALPPSTVAETAAPGGDAPVAKAGAKKALPADPDKMSKADWAAKDLLIQLQAIEKATLASPALAQMVVGKKQAEVFEITRAYTKYNLETHEMAKAGTL